MTSLSSASGPAGHTSSIELLAPGTRLGDRYEIRAVVGSGGQAVVYLATDRDLNRDVALKILRSDRSSAALEKRFRREAAIARDAAHPNLVRPHCTRLARQRPRAGAHDRARGPRLPEWNRDLA
jgi:predicted Ser/Thr protein kinase